MVSPRIAFKRSVVRGARAALPGPAANANAVVNASQSAASFVGRVDAPAKAGESSDSAVAVKVPQAARTGLYVQNRAPLTPAPFMKLPIGSITPRGWLRHQLELEARGMTGRLPEISPWLNFEKSSWAAADEKFNSVVGTSNNF